MVREIVEVSLPGVGVRFEFTSVRGERIAVVSHRSGRQELALYERGDPDACRSVIELDADDAATLASILGAPQVAASAAAMQRIEGLAIDWVRVGQGSGAAGTTIADGRYRTVTGSSIVAVIRGEQTHPAPEPDFVLVSGDVAVAVGTPAGLAELRSLLAA
jgi:TrkA domain protein